MVAGAFILYNLEYLLMVPREYVLQLTPNSEVNLKGTHKEFCDTKVDYYRKHPNDASELTLYNWVKQLDLYCWDKNTIEDISSSFFVGAFAGSFVLPRFSDVVGRKPMFLLGLSIYMCVLILVLVCTDFYFMCVLIFFGGVGETGRYYVAYVYLVEFVPDHRQSLCGLLIFVVFGVAQMFFASYFAIITKEWSYLSYAGMCFVAFSFVTVYFRLPETPRYQYSTGKYEEAAETLNQMQISNGIQNKKKFVFKKQLDQKKGVRVSNNSMAEKEQGVDQIVDRALSTANDENKRGTLLNRRASAAEVKQIE
jgi:hypothetical protein